MNSKPDAENYALRGLLSVRYTLVAKDKETEWTDKDLPRLAAHRRDRCLRLYENENWVPMGFTYDCYVTADQLERVSEEERARFCAARFCWTTTDLRLWQPVGTLPDES